MYDILHCLLVRCDQQMRVAFGLCHRRRILFIILHNLIIPLPNLFKLTGNAPVLILFHASVASIYKYVVLNRLFSTAVIANRE